MAVRGVLKAAHEPVEGRPLDDQQLVEYAQQGDVDAYQELMARYQAIAYRTALVLTGPDGADDAVQEAFVKAWRALGRFRPEAPFRPWLLRIVAHESSNWRRAAGRRAGLAQLVGRSRLSGDAAPSPEESAVLDERRAGLAAAIDALPDKQRLVVTCRYLLELSESETAVVLGWPRGSVKSRLARALARLRIGLGEVEHA